MWAEPRSSAFSSDINLFCYGKGIVDLDTKVSDPQRPKRAAQLDDYERTTLLRSTPIFSISSSTTSPC